jgi:hypothetical protein
MSRYWEYLRVWTWWYGSEKLPDIYMVSNPPKEGFWCYCRNVCGCRIGIDRQVGFGCAKGPDDEGVGSVVSWIRTDGRNIGTRFAFHLVDLPWKEL